MRASRVRHGSCIIRCEPRAVSRAGCGKSPDHTGCPLDSNSQEPDIPADEDREQLLPGWSSLVILLTLFGLISGVTLLVILRGDDTHVSSDAGGTRAYQPSDFPEIAFDEPLLPAVVEAHRKDEQNVFHVAPAPFSADIFPCSECHAELDTNTERRELMFHDEIVIRHGSEDRWCFDCHNTEDRDHLRLASGELVGFDESYRLCGQCHGTIFRDWREGIHGRRRGFWNGAKSYLLCAHCHNPHQPAFQSLKPLPPPVRPTFLDATRDEDLGS